MNLLPPSSSLDAVMAGGEAECEGEVECNGGQELTCEPGDRVIIRGAGYTTGWLKAELTSSKELGGHVYVAGVVGDVREEEVKREGHTWRGHSEWHTTHLIPHLHGVAALAFVGSHFEFLATAYAASLRTLTIMPFSGLQQPRGLSLRVLTQRLRRQEQAPRLPHHPTALRAAGRGAQGRRARDGGGGAKRRLGAAGAG